MWGFYVCLIKDWAAIWEQFIEVFTRRTDLGTLFLSQLDLFLHKSLSVCSLILQPPLHLLSPHSLSLQQLLSCLDFPLLTYTHTKKKTDRLRHRGASNLLWEDLIGNREKNTYKYIKYTVRCGVTGDAWKNNSARDCLSEYYCRRAC